MSWGGIKWSLVLELEDSLCVHMSLARPLHFLSKLISIVDNALIFEVAIIDHSLSVEYKEVGLCNLALLLAPSIKECGGAQTWGPPCLSKEMSCNKCATRGKLDCWISIDIARFGPYVWSGLWACTLRLSQSHLGVDHFFHSFSIINFDSSKHIFVLGILISVFLCFFLQGWKNLKQKEN